MLTEVLSAKGLHWHWLALIGTLALCTLGPIVVGVEGALPLSLQSLLVCWIPLMMGWRAGLACIGLYLAAGTMGLPVFADHRGGIEVLGGPTGGYLLGFPVAAFLLGLAAETVQERPRRMQLLTVALGMVRGHGVILACGMPWQMRFDADLDPMALLQSLARPVALKSAIGTLLAVAVMRGVQGRA